MFAKQIAYLSAAYDREVQQQTAAVYWQQLGSLPDKPFVQAVELHVNESRYFPTVAELRELTQSFIRREGPALLPAPEITAEAVLRQHARLIGADEDQYVEELLNP